MKKKKRSGLSKLVGVVGGLALANGLIEQISSQETEKAWYIEDEYNWIHGKISYSKAGEGAPLLLIHSTMIGAGSHEWKNIFKHLTRTNTVYAIDLPGFGASEKRNITYSSYLYATAIKDFINEVIGESTFVIASGHAAGFAATANSLDPSIINELIMINPKEHRPKQCVKDKVIEKTLGIPVLGQSLYNVLSAKLIMPLWLNQEVFYSKKSLSDHNVGSFYKAAHRELGQAKWAIQSLYAGRLDTDYYRHMPQEANVHLFLGEYNEQFLPNDYFETILRFPKTGELPHIEQWRSVFKAIQQIQNPDYVY